MAAVSLTPQCRHDRSIARRPPATVGTVRQHRFELAELTVRGIDYDGERMVTVTVGNPHSGLSRTMLRQFHVALGLRHKNHLVVGADSMVGENDAFVGEQPAAQPEFNSRRLLFLQCVEEYMPGNDRDIHFQTPFDSFRA